MHECPDCGQACYCDGEDTEMDAAFSEHVSGPRDEGGTCINPDCGREDEEAGQ